jgi:anti-sigma factor RsiW
MSKNLQNIKDIDDYLSGRLNPEDRNEFEKKLKGNSDLQEELNTIRQAIEGIQGYGFKQMLKELHNKHFGKKTEE